MCAIVAGRPGGFAHQAEPSAAENHREAAFRNDPAKRACVRRILRLGAKDEPQNTQMTGFVFSMGLKGCEEAFIFLNRFAENDHAKRKPKCRVR